MLRFFSFVWLVFILALLQVGCDSNEVYAPVTEINRYHVTKTQPIVPKKVILTEKPKTTVKFLEKPPIELPVAKVAWLKPAKGKVIRSYSTLNKGIDIAGHPGEAIHAAAAGRVVYCGDGLRGYGNLIIIKHNSLFLSAYAHNRRLLVKEGESVKQGQKIAEMGNTGTNKTKLHFEIRKAGKPIDPLILLQ